VWLIAAISGVLTYQLPLFVKGLDRAKNTIKRVFMVKDVYRCDTFKGRSIDDIIPSQATPPGSHSLFDIYVPGEHIRFLVIPIELDLQINNF